MFKSFIVKFVEFRLNCDEALCACKYWLAVGILRYGYIYLENDIMLLVLRYTALKAKDVLQAINYWHNDRNYYNGFIELSSHINIILNKFAIIKGVGFNLNQFHNIHAHLMTGNWYLNIYLAIYLNILQLE